MTGDDLAARVAAGRRAQGLPDTVTDPAALDALAALVAATSSEAGDRRGAA